MIDQFTLDIWEQKAKRDDWRTYFAGSDIRMMLEEIRRLRATLEAERKNHLDEIRRDAKRRLENGL